MFPEIVQIGQFETVIEALGVAGWREKKLEIYDVDVNDPEIPWPVSMIRERNPSKAAF